MDRAFGLLTVVHLERETNRVLGQLIVVHLKGKLQVLASTRLSVTRRPLQPQPTALEDHLRSPRERGMFGSSCGHVRLKRDTFLNFVS